MDPYSPVVIGYIEEVVVVGVRDTRMAFAKSDTGAARTSIDTHLAAEVGTSSIKDVVRVTSASSKSGTSRPVVDVAVVVRGTRYVPTVSIEDRSHMEYPVLLGRDILQYYHVDVHRRADIEEQKFGLDAW